MHFICIGRLLFDKGILEYIKALRILKKKYSNFEGTMLGPIYQSNNTAIDIDLVIGKMEVVFVKTNFEITDNIVELLRSKNLAD